jgi:hypothetical protein
MVDNWLQDLPVNQLCTENAAEDSRRTKDNRSHHCVLAEAGCISGLNMEGQRRQGPAMGDLARGREGGA